MARRMVTEWGMSDKLGPLRYGDNQEEIFLGHSVTQHEERLRRDRPADRRGDPPADRRGRGAGERDPDRHARRSAPAGQGAARVRDADAARRSGRCCAASRSPVPTRATTSRDSGPQVVGAVAPARPPRIARAGGLEAEPQAGAGTRRRHGWTPTGGGAGARRWVGARRFAGVALDRPRVMGVVNVTPDSFSDGGEAPAADAAIARGLSMAAAGADFVDVGGESTRPGLRSGAAGRRTAARDSGGCGVGRAPGSASPSTPAARR